MPCLLLAFLVMRVTDQSLSSDLPLTTRRGKVSREVSQSLESDMKRLFTYSGLAPWLRRAANLGKTAFWIEVEFWSQSRRMKALS